MKNLKKQTLHLNLETYRRRIHALIGLIYSMGFSYLQYVFYIKPAIQEVRNMGFMQEDLTLENIGFVSVPILLYLLLSLNFCLLFNLFKEIKTYKEKGLIYFFIKFLMYTIPGVFVGVFFVGFSFSISVLLFLLLIISLFFGLNWGLSAEFKK